MSAATAMARPDISTGLADLRVPDRSLSLVQERFGIFQIWRVETLDEPIVNRLQEGVGLTVSAFASANALRGWWRRAAPTNGPAVAVQSSMPAAVRASASPFLPSVKKHLAPQTIQFSFEKSFVCVIRPSELLRRANEARLRLAEARMGRGDMAEIQRAAAPVSVAFDRRNSAAHELDPALGIAALG